MKFRPVKTLKKLKRAAQNYMEYVYIGNLPGEDNGTYCPQCGALLIKRAEGIFVEHLDDGICSKCGRTIDIIGL